MGTDKETKINIMNSIKIESQILIRRCKLNDLEGVIEVNERELPEDYPYFFYKSILDNFPEAFLVATDKDNKVIGYVMWRVEQIPSMDSLKYVNKGHLVSIAVSEEYRRRGIGTTLLSNSISAVKKHKITELVLEVRVSNYIAIKLYEKFNLKMNSVKKNYYRDGENAYYMVRNADTN